MSLDTQGHELETVRGARPLLEQGLLKMLQIEICFPDVEEPTILQMLTFLDGMNYAASLLCSRMRGELADRASWFPSSRASTTKRICSPRPCRPRRSLECGTQDHEVHNPRALVSAPVPCHVAALVDPCGLGAPCVVAPIA